MAKWEYAQLDLEWNTREGAKLLASRWNGKPLSPISGLEYLNRVGVEGWEVAVAVDVLRDRGTRVLLLKRQVG